MCLIAAWLDHESLVDRSLISARHVSANGVGIERLPSILLVGALHLAVRPNLHHAVDERLVELILLVPPVLCRASRNKVLLSLRALLRHQTHWQLSNVDRVVWVMLTRSTRILPDRRCSLVLVDEVEIHVVDHSLLLAHLAGAWSLD